MQKIASKATKAKKPPRHDGVVSPADSIEQAAAMEAVAALDRVAAELERQWGVGRLPTLVDGETAAKFGERLFQFDDALARRDWQAVREIAPRLAKGWAVLDRLARQAGHVTQDTAGTWIVTSDSGTGYQVWPSDAEAGAAAKAAGQGGDVRHIGMPELLRVWEAFPTVNSIREAFPGATVTAARAAAPVDFTNGDEVPF